MSLRSISSYDELKKELSKSDKGFVLLYKAGSESSECALGRLEKQVENNKNVTLLKVDVSKTRDIHPKYNITSVPSLLQFDKDELKNVIKGCMTEDYYNSLVNGIYSKPKNGESQEKQKRVVVYGTPTCSWCRRIRDYFNEKNIKYRYIDVAANPAIAEEMKRKSGQMGVPQTEIEGQMIVGFDKPKINRLLGIN